MLDMNPILQMSNSRSMIDKRTTNDVASESESTSSTASQNAHHHPSNDRHGIPGVLFSTGPPSSSSHSSSNLTGTLDSDRSSISGPLNDSHSTLAESLSTNSTSSSEESSGSADEEDSQSDDDERSQDTLFQISHHPHLLHHHHHHHRGAPIGRKFPGHDKSDLFLKSLEVDPFAPTKFFVRNRNKKDLDANPAVSSSRNSLYTVGSSKSFTPPQSGPQAAEYNSKVTSGVNCAFKNAAGFGTRTIKAATRYIDAQGKRAASLTKQQKSLSMVDLASSPPSHTLVQPPLHLIDTETSGQPDLDRQLSPTTLSTTTAIQSENSGGNNIDKNDTNATGASSTNLQMNAQRHSAHNRNETPIELSANPKWNSNHATGAIRSIIESQYAVLQQETNQPRHGPEVRRKKKQNKLRVNFVNSSNGTFADHGVTLKPKDFSRNTLLPDFGGCAPPITCSVSDSMFDLTKECIQDSVHEPNEASSLFVKHYLPADLSGESMVDNRSLQSLPNRTQNPSNTEVNSVRNEQTMTDNVMSTASPSDDPVPKDPMLAQLRALREQAQKPTKSQQFSCLPARSSPYAGNEGPLRNADLSHSHTVRSLSLQAPDCPLNRLQFYKTFAQLVRRGRRGLHSASALTNQQMGGFFELVYKQELRDLIWLEIKAWLVDRSMIEQDRHLCQQRKNIPDTLNKVMRFTIQPSHVDNERAERIEKIERIEQKIDKLDKFDKLEKVMMQYAGPDDNIGASLSSTTALDSQPGNLKTLIDQDLLAASVAVKLSISEQQPNTDLHRVKEDARRNASDTSDSPNPDDENCACSETLSRLCKFCVDKETSAFEQVNKMLAEIDEIEQLYPCVKALAIDYPLYSSDEFTARIKSLYLYQNIIRDLREKINLLAKLFHITNREAAGWPNFRDSGSLMDFPVNTSSDCTPEVIGNSNSVNTSTTTTINSAPGSASDPKYGYSYKLNAPVINSASSKHVHFRCDANSSVIDSSRCNSIIDLNSPDSIGSSNILLLNTNSNIDFKSKDSNTATSISSEQSIKPENPFFQCKPSVYRRYVDKSLKHKGLRYIYHQLSHILRPLLYRVHAALKKPTTSGIHGQLDGAPSASPSALHHFMMSSVGAETSNIGGSSSSGNNCGHCNMNNTSGCNNSVVNNTGNVNNSASNNSQPSSQSNQCNCLTTSQASVDLLMKSSNMIMAGRQSEASIEELSQFGVWSNAYQQMGLPTFHRPFLFLLRVTVDVVHECLILRLEQQPEQPSNVSVGQLIRECKEVIKASVQIKQHYINLAQIVLGEAGTELFEAQLDSFNDDMKTMLSIYLRYLESYMLCMQSVTSKRVSTLRQKGYLEEEWNFVRYYCPHIPGGEALAANKFCVLASDLLTSIGDYIRNGVADCFVQVDHALESLPTDPALFRKSLLGACRSFKLVFQEANAKACQATAFAKSLRKHLEIAAEYRISTSGGQLLERLRQTEHVRVIAPNCASHLLFVPAHMQTKVGALWQLLDMTCGGRCSVDPEEVGEPFAGYLLITNLTPALESAWSGSCVYLEPTIETTLSLSYVEANGVLFLVCDPAQLTARCRQFAAQMHEHVHVLTHQTSCNQAIADALTALKHQALSIQENTADSLKAIYKRLDLSPCHEIDEPERNILQMRCLDVLHQGFKFAFEYEKALTRLITGDLRTKLAHQLTTFAGQWITFVRTRCEKGRGLRARWVYPGLQYLIVALEPQYIQVLDEQEFQHLKEEVDHVLTHLLGSTDRSPKLLLPLPQNYQGPYPVLSAETINKPLASSLNFQRSQSVVNVKGMFGDLNFLEQRQMNESSHEQQKGTRLEDWMSKKQHTNNNLPIILNRKRPQSSRLSGPTHASMQQGDPIPSSASIGEEQTKSILSASSGTIAELTPPSSASIQSNKNDSNPLRTVFSDNKTLHDLDESAKKPTIKYDDTQSTDTVTNRCKLGNVKIAIRTLDEGRDTRLKERGLIGCVSDLVIQRASLQIAARKVNFPWQRGFKIGEGRFGKVYTAVNNSTGELIAMKEIHLQQANDSRAIKETIDEIRIFEGIKHPNIVKYFGVEIHRDELYIFMEYCNEGSLENAVQLNLPEQLVRKYTRQLLEAVNCLHEHGIVHRDIKSANIFLTSDGNLKLGDFGCCMKLKNHSTMPGELCTLVGTPAYMAPEMFTRNSIEGHGRSSDIWSIGCVVLEMLTGRRPWHDLENSYQIMFKVGMGETPEIPDDICTEGKSFISHCLRQDPRLRWSTGQLLCHPFTKVLEDDYI